MTTICQITALESALKEAGFKASAWRGQRIYLNGYGRDIKAYVTFDDATSIDFKDAFEGCALKVYSNCNQDRAWLINRAKQVKHGIMEQLNEKQVTPMLGGLEVCENWREVIL